MPDGYQTSLEPLQTPDICGALESPGSEVFAEIPATLGLHEPRQGGIDVFVAPEAHSACDQPSAAARNDVRIVVLDLRQQLFHAISLAIDMKDAVSVQEPLEDGPRRRRHDVHDIVG